MAARLKVFTWSDGFHAFTVAVSSRPKALEAWGSKQDLFKTGLASELSGGPDYDAALRTPGEVVQRGLAIDVGNIRNEPSSKKTGHSNKAKKARIDKLETDLAALDSDHDNDLGLLDEEASRLGARRAALVEDHETRRGALIAKLRTAREA